MHYFSDADSPIPAGGISLNTTLITPMTETTASVNNPNSVNSSDEQNPAAAFDDAQAARTDLPGSLDRQSLVMMLIECIGT